MSTSLTPETFAPSELCAPTAPAVVTTITAAPRSATSVRAMLSSTCSLRRLRYRLPSVVVRARVAALRRALLEERDDTVAAGDHRVDLGAADVRVQSLADLLRRQRAHARQKLTFAPRQPRGLLKIVRAR